MRSLQRLGLVILLALAVAMPAIADKAKSLYEKGRDAEARQNYEAAYELYKQAYDLKPKELQYRTAYERTKFLAAASHVHRGQLLRDAEPNTPSGPCHEGTLPSSGFIYSGHLHDSTLDLTRF